MTFDDGASGLVERNDIRDFTIGIDLPGIARWVSADSPGPVVRHNAIHDCKLGLVIGYRMNRGPAWSLGEGNVFMGCAEGDVVDEREEDGESGDDFSDCSGDVFSQDDDDSDDYEAYYD